MQLLLQYLKENTAVSGSHQNISPPKKKLGMYSMMDIGARNRIISLMETTTPIMRPQAPQRKLKRVWEKMYEPGYSSDHHQMRRA